MLDSKQEPLFFISKSRGFFLLTILCVTCLVVSRAHCQNTAIVFGPDVIDEEFAVDFRVAYNADEESWVYRNHVQYGFSDSFSLRGITLHAIDSSDRWDFRFFRVEGLWQFLEDEEAGWDSAVRFELEIAEGDNLPSRARLAWTGSYNIDDYWQIKGNFLTGYEIGPASDPGALLEVRGQISRQLNKTSRLALDYFGNMNNTEAFGNWESQKHQLGPTLSMRFNKNVLLTVGTLLGLSRDASDAEYRVTLTRLW